MGWAPKALAEALEVGPAAHDEAALIVRQEAEHARNRAPRGTRRARCAGRRHRRARARGNRRRSSSAAGPRRAAANTGHLPRSARAQSPWKRTPRRRWKVQVRPSGEVSQCSARSGSIRAGSALPGGKRTRPSNIQSTAASSVVEVARWGSSLAMSVPVALMRRTAPSPATDGPGSVSPPLMAIASAPTTRSFIAPLLTTRQTSEEAGLKAKSESGLGYSQGLWAMAGAGANAAES